MKFIFIKWKIKQIIFLTIIFFVGIINGTHAQVTVESQKAHWIFNIAEYVSWPNEQTFDIYKLGAIGVSTEEINAIQTVIDSKTIKNKNVKLIVYKKIKDIENCNILFVSEKMCDDIEEITAKIKGKNILLITDKCPKQQYIMVNLLLEGKNQFEINKEKALAEDILISEKLLARGGSKIDLQLMLRRKEEELTKKEKQLTEIEKVLNEKEKQIDIQKDENKKQKDENKKQADELNIKEQEITAQKNKAKDLFLEIQNQEQKLVSNQQILKTQEQSLKEQQIKSEIQNKELNAKAEEVKKQEKRISQQKKTLNQQTLLIKTQKGIIYIIIGFLVIVAALAIYIFKSYKEKQRINSELQHKNAEIQNQKEEIETQAQQLENTNRELEKLSLVASKTHNAVVIMDKKGNFEWVNAGFTRMYGFTLQLLKHECDENLLKASSHPEIAKILNTCVSEKKTVIYETVNKTRNNQTIWVQTTLTPILDDDDEILRLVAIETDINEIKKAEQEIREQHQKIVEQARQLEETNRELEKLSIVASETDNAILIMDAQGNFEWVNAAYTRMFGLTFEQLVKDISKNIIGQQTSEEAKALINDCLINKNTITYEFKAITKSKKEIWVQTTLTPILDNNGNIRKVIAIDSDITKLKKAETEIREKNEELELQKSKIEDQNKKIHSSIGYAQTIQKAILPIRQETEKFFESFVIFRPKDIVSGDFFWFTDIPEENLFFVAAVDCTGHGVPGAFMSMIGSRLLNEIVKEKKIFKPSQILNMLNQEVKKALKQEKTDNNDGMDLCLCSIEPLKNINHLVYCGAKNPLYYYKQKTGVIEILKADRKSIGGVRFTRNQTEFTDQELVLNSGDQIYLCTDGYIDQNNFERKRFGSDRFVVLLNKVADQVFIKQKEIIEHELETFMATEDQRDDITVWGIKLL